MVMMVQEWKAKRMVFWINVSVYVIVHDSVEAYLLWSMIQCSVPVIVHDSVEAYLS